MGISNLRRFGDFFWNIEDLSGVHKDVKRVLEMALKFFGLLGSIERPAEVS